MKRILLFLLAINFWTCQTDKKSYPSNEPSVVNAKMDDPLKKRDTILAINPTTLEYNKEFYGQTMSFTASYFLDTLFTDYYRRHTLRTRDIEVEIKDDNEWPQELCEEIKNAMQIDLRYNRQSIDYAIQKADLNFDTYEDIYFVKDGYAQNTSYTVYLYDKEEKKYVRATDFEKLNWSKLETNFSEKLIYIFNHRSATEGSKRTYTTTEQGKLTLLESETTTRIKGKGQGLWVIHGQLVNGKWQQDTTSLK